MSQIKTICFNLLESGGGGGGGAEHIPNKTIHRATFIFCNDLICKISTSAHHFFSEKKQTTNCEGRYIRLTKASLLT